MSIRDLYPELYAQAEAELDDDFFDDDNELPSSYVRQALVAGLRKFDPAAVVMPMLDIRLSGIGFQGGELTAAAANVLVHLQKEIEAAAPDAPEEALKIGVSHLSEGSLIMHVRPAPALMEAGTIDHPLPQQLEQALMRILDIHDALEFSPDSLPSKTRSLKDIQKRLRYLTEALDSADADLQMDLHHSDGRHRRSCVSNRGRSHAKRLFERETRVTQITISGRVDGLSSSGKVVLASSRKKREIDGVPTATVKDLHIGSSLRVKVSYTLLQDAFGGQKKETWQFVALTEHHDSLEFEE